MLFDRASWPKLADGSVTVAFRNWKRPTAKAGGTLRSPVGMLAIDSVEPIDPSELDDAAARAAGEPDLATLVGRLRTGEGRTLYRIRFHLAGDDPRVALREDDDLDAEAVEALTAALSRSDARASDGAWTRRVLELLAANEGVRSADLCGQVDLPQAEFKTRVRRLKSLGLTESLERGYRISPRGRAYLDLTST